MSKLVPPHGSDEVMPLLLPEVERAAALEHAKTLKQVKIRSREVSDVSMFAMGAYTPFTGFMNEADWRGVCAEMKTADGLFWPIPITCPVAQDVAVSIAEGEEVALVNEETGEIMAILEVSEKYSPDKKFECQHVYRTTDMEHPGVQATMNQGPVNLAGRVKALSEGEYAEKYGKLFMRPAESRAEFAKRGWSKVAAFQTRNPMHRSHEFLAKLAVETLDGVFIHQVLGKLKPGDIPAEVRTKAIQAMIDNYFVPGTVIQAGYPIEMRYAGPREALLHAVIRQNFGCSHLIVGRDHAGVGDYYGPFDAQDIFDELWDGALVTKPFKVDITFYCKKCDGMATAKTCPHSKEDRITISGTEQRRRLAAGEPIPPEFSRPEVVKVLQEYYATLNS